LHLLWQEIDAPTDVKQCAETFAHLTAISSFDWWRVSTDERGRPLERLEGMTLLHQLKENLSHYEFKAELKKNLSV
jgi:hypothetical protein